MPILSLIVFNESTWDLPSGFQTVQNISEYFLSCDSNLTVIVNPCRAAYPEMITKGFYEYYIVCHLPIIYDESCRLDRHNNTIVLCHSHSM